MQQFDRALVRPGFAINPRREQRVVHVTDRENAHVERDLVSVLAVGIARPVESLVMTPYEAMHGARKPAKFTEQGIA